MNCSEENSEVGRRAHQQARCAAVWRGVEAGRGSRGIVNEASYVPHFLRSTGM